MEHEEMSCNRAECSWVYRSAKGISNTAAIGSTPDLPHAGNINFVNCAFPTLDTDASAPQPVTIGADCRESYTTPDFLTVDSADGGTGAAPVAQVARPRRHRERSPDRLDRVVPRVRPPLARG